MNYNLEIQIRAYRLDEIREDHNKMKIKIKKVIVLFILITILFHSQLKLITSFKIFDYADESLISILLLVAGYKIIKTKKIKKQIFSIVILVILFIFLGAAGFVLNSKGTLSTIDFILAMFLASKFWLLICSLLIIQVDNSIYEYILEAITKIANVAVVVATINLLLPNVYLKLCPWGFVQRRFGIISPTSIFEHPGTYGWFLVMVASLYYIKWIKEQRKENIIRCIIYTIFALFSMKAKVIGSIIVVIVFTELFYRSRKINLKKLILPTILVLIVVSLSWSFLYETFIQYYTISETGNVSARAAFTHGAIEICKDYFPLGVGFGKFASWYARIRYSQYYFVYGLNTVYGLRPNSPFFGTDTFWPAVFGEAGLIGALIYIMALFLVLKQLRIRFKKTGNIYTFWGTLVLIQGLVESLGAPTFNSAPQNVLIAVAIVIGLNYYGGKQSEESLYIHA